MNIVLAGMPGSGKTTVAQIFRERGKTVYDTDEEIVKENGSITDIFRNFGEDCFRALESEVVERLSGLTDVVIATGGGCLLKSGNVELLKKNGKIVYLRATVETLVKRMEGDDSRPLLQGELCKRLKKLYRERFQIYECAADLIIDTDNLTPEEVANKITEFLK